MPYDVKLLDAIKDCIVVVGCDPVEVEEEGVDRNASWHFLLDGDPVSLFCSFPRGEPSQENERAKEFLARDLYIKEHENRMTVKAEICHEYVFHGWTTIDVNVPPGASEEEMFDLANEAAMNAEDLMYPYEDYDLPSLYWTVETVNGREVQMQEPPCIVCCYIRKIAECEILLQENEYDSVSACLKMNELITEARSLLQNM